MCFVFVFVSCCVVLFVYSSACSFVCLLAFLCEFRCVCACVLCSDRCGPCAGSVAALCISRGTRSASICALGAS